MSESIPFLRFDPRAQRMFDRWRGGLERRLRAGEEHPALESHFSKYRSLIPSLALLIHLVDKGSGPVPVGPLRKAIAWGRYLSSHARRIYSAAVMADVAAAKRLAARIKKGEIRDGFTERDIYRNCWTGLNQEGVEKAVRVLVEHGWIRSQIVSTDGRPKTVFLINPRVLVRSSGGAGDAAVGAPVNVGTPPETPEGTDRTDRSPVLVHGGPVDAPQAAPEGTARTDESAQGSEWGEL